MIFNYRQFWEQHHQQKIPPGFQIHHRDENRSNNHIDNLQCVSPQEHYEIHKARGENRPLILIAGWNKGQPKSEEHKVKIGARNSVDLKGHGITEETRAKISTALKGKKHSPETRAKISSAQKGKPGRRQSAET